MESASKKPLPPIPPKRYFTIGEVSELCGVKAYVLRYWEQEFTQLKPMKRRGNRRYYQHHEVLLIRRIRDLLYEQGFTISGARNQLTEHGVVHVPEADAGADDAPPPDDDIDDIDDADLAAVARAAAASPAAASARSGVAAPRPAAESRDAAGAARTALRTASTLPPGPLSTEQVRDELHAIRALLVG
jgi:DNA-binding transcriptional MerR regulator